MGQNTRIRVILRQAVPTGYQSKGSEVRADMLIRQVCNDEYVGRNVFRQVCVVTWSR